VLAVQVHHFDRLRVGRSSTSQRPAANPRPQQNEAPHFGIDNRASAVWMPGRHVRPLAIRCAGPTPTRMMAGSAPHRHPGPASGGVGTVGDAMLTLCPRDLADHLGPGLLPRRREGGRHRDGLADLLDRGRGGGLRQLRRSSAPRPGAVGGPGDGAVVRRRVRLHRHRHHPPPPHTRPDRAKAATSATTSCRATDAAATPPRCSPRPSPSARASASPTC
jgi:hypothetical protein